MYSKSYFFEEWRPVVGYEGLYEVSNFGRVKSLDRYKVCGNLYRKRKGGILKPAQNKGGYLLVGLYKNGNRKVFFVHRLVAVAFIPNPHNYPEVNHKNENKTDNRVENLEWCTNEYNHNYGTRTERVTKKLSKPVNQYSLSGEFIKQYPSINEVHRELGCSQGNISQCCNGKYKKAYGFIWRYA